jgi:hypothetical protein
VIFRQRRFPVWAIHKTHVSGVNVQIAAEQSTQETSSQHVTTTVLVKMETIGPRTLGFVQRPQKAFLQLRRLLQTRAPNVNGAAR